MTPTIVHRYAFTVCDAIETLLGDAVGNCETWRIRIEGDEVIIDVVAPVPGIVPSIEDVASLRFGNADNRAAEDENTNNIKSSTYDSETSNETAKSNAPDPEPELKGGPLARRAAICCGERGFWTFLDVGSADEAKIEVCRRCGVDSRKMFDHNDIAAEKWAEIDRKYRLWLEGYD